MLTKAARKYITTATSYEFVRKSLTMNKRKIRTYLHPRFKQARPLLNTEKAIYSPFSFPFHIANDVAILEIACVLQENLDDYELGFTKDSLLAHVFS